MSCQIFFTRLSLKFRMLLKTSTWLRVKLFLYLRNQQIDEKPILLFTNCQNIEHLAFSTN